MKVAPCQARDLGNVQRISVWHVIGIPVDDFDGSPLNCLYLFCVLVIRWCQTGAEYSKTGLITTK